MVPVAVVEMAHRGQMAAQETRQALLRPKAIMAVLRLMLRLIMVAAVVVAHRLSAQRERLRPAATAVLVPHQAFPVVL